TPGVPRFAQGSHHNLTGHGPILPVPPIFDTNPSHLSANVIDNDDEVNDETDDADPLGERLGDAVRSSPPWLTSLVVHMMLLVITGLLFRPELVRERLDLELVIAENVGEQLIDDNLDLGLLEPIEIDEPTLTPDDLAPTEDPFAAPPNPLEVHEEGNRIISDIAAPNIGIALTGRNPGTKQALLAAYGGNVATEQAVVEALKWLKRNQLRDGSWKLSGPYADGVFGVDNPTAATSMALLAFQGAGHTHQRGEYQPEVAKGWKFLIKQQQTDGSFTAPSDHHRLYSQAQATIALCELYGMTKDPGYRDAAQLALNYATRIQSAEGGWRYYPGSDADMSVTGWFVMAYQSGLMAGLTVPSPTLDAVSRYIDSVSNEYGDRYRYNRGRPATESMTAEALLCRQYLGWERDDGRLASGIDYLLQSPVNFRNQNVYAWYYSTQVIHHVGGPDWEKWNDTMRQELPKHQITAGKERGSWDPSRDAHGELGGRLYVTCLCTFMLEVYYRHLPIYDFAFTEGMKSPAE
ncbi:MAG: terpene cyclase/mutase family protein, partial [Planctomycetales bacterium]|nr:terpene cyclase/mutase family protein [Planctomycetales bacterium]